MNRFSPPDPVAAYSPGHHGSVLEDVAVAWEQWGRHPDAWFTIVHGDAVATT